METAIQFDEKTRAELKTIFQNQEPLNIYTQFDMGDKFNTQISSPKFMFAEDGARIESQGFSLSVESDKALSFINANFDMGGFLASTPNNKALTLGKIHYQGKKTLTNAGAYIGSENGDISSILLTGGNDKALSLSTGKIDFSSSTTTEGTSQNIDFKIKINDITLNTSKIGSLSSLTQLKHLDTKALADLNTLQMESLKQMLQCKAMPDQTQTSLTTLSALLEKDPEFNFTLDTSSDVGASQLAVAINSKGLSIKDLKNDNDWKNKIQASVTLQVPMAFVEKLFTLGTEAANKENELGRLHQRLNEAANLGLLVQDGKTIKFDATLKQGATTLNGKPFNGL